MMGRSRRKSKPFRHSALLAAVGIAYRVRQVLSLGNTMPPTLVPPLSTRHAPW
ncbi:MAG: hypothetical protein KDI32_10660 [Pseudomonadales bacterium]|nr:hypothetical protein [Pseudomonadales bacterium]